MGLVLAIGTSAWFEAEVPDAPPRLPDSEPTVRELTAVEGIGATLARRILDARWQAPPSERAAAVEHVRHLGPVRRERLETAGFLWGDQEERKEALSSDPSPGTLPRPSPTRSLLLPADSEPGP